MRSCLSVRPERTAFLTERPFAHRGLHGAGVSENGMAAFDAAISAGYGIECDVRLSRDGVAMVFHDATLERMIDAAGTIADSDADALRRIFLRDGGAIPRLAQLLAVLDGMPLLIEMKRKGRRVARLCAAVAGDLAAYPEARAAVMSFHPLVVRWFARHAPGVMRGLVMTQQGEGWRGPLKRALALWLAKPDFLACDVRDLPSTFTARARSRGLPVLTWTVRSDAERERAARHADQIIFENPHG